MTYGAAHRSLILHCACTEITPVQYEKFLNPRTNGIRLSINLVYKLQKQFLDGYAYQMILKGEKVFLKAIKKVTFSVQD